MNCLVLSRRHLWGFGKTTTDNQTAASNANKNTNHDSGNEFNASLNKAVAFMFGIDITLLQMLFLVHEKWSTIHVYKIIVFLDEK